MRLNVILLLLAIQGLAPSCCEGNSDELISGEGPWKEDDWSGNSASSTGEDDELTGFDSGSSANDQKHDSKNPRTSPRISRTLSNKRFVTSGDGEDSSGSREDRGSNSNSHGRKDHGSTNEEFDSIMGLANIGDAIDVMKKLKKAKSDEELVKKLKSGPESLGVAFKTFEQLSGLWISVMHRIWRVWKAKGAKVVMHSIVDNLMNNTGRAITRKVGDFLSTRRGSVEDPNEASGSAIFKDEGSTQPETTHRLNTLHNKTDIPLEKVSINFVKNISSKANKQPEKTRPSKKSVKATIEKVKVSFTSKNVSDPTRIQTTKNTSQERKNQTSLVKKISLDSTNIKVTAKSENSFKAANSSSSNVSNVESATSMNNEHPLKTNKRLESGHYKNTDNVSLGDAGKKVERNGNTGTARQVTRDKERAPKFTQHVDKDYLQNQLAYVTRVSPIGHYKNTDNVSLGDAGNKVERNGDTETARKVTRDKERTPKFTQHVNRDYLQKQQANVTMVSPDTQTENNGLMKSSSLKSQKADSQVNNTTSGNHVKVTDQNIKTEGRLGNTNYSSLKMNATGEKVVISEETNAAKDTTENTRVLKKLKINFLETKRKNNRSRLDLNSRHAIQADALKVQKKSKSLMQNKSNPKPDSNENTVQLSKTSQSNGNDTKGRLLDKAVLRFEKIDAIRNRTKEHFRNKTFGNNSTTLATTSAKSEKIVVNLYGKKKTHKGNKTNTFVNIAKGVDKSNGNATNDSSQNNKITKTSFSGSVVKVPQEDNQKNQKGGFYNTTNPPNELHLTQNNVTGNSTQLLDKSAAKDRVQVEQVNRASDDTRISRNDSVDLSLTRTPNKNRVPLSNNKSQGVEENTQKLEISDHYPTTTAKIALVQKTNITQKHVKSQTLQKANGDNQGALKKDVPKSERKPSQNKSSNAILVSNINKARNTTSSSLVNTYASITLAPPTKTDSDLSSKDSRGPPKPSIKISRKVHSPVESIVGRKEKSGTSKADTKVNIKVVSRGEEGMQIHDQKSDVTHSSENGESHNTDRHVKHDRDSNTVHDSGSGSSMPHGESALMHEPESHTSNDPVTGVTSDPIRGVTKKQDENHGHEGHVSKEAVRHRPESELSQKSKGVVIFGPRSEEKHYPEYASTKPSHVINITAERSTRTRDSHRLSSQLKVSSARSAKKPGLASKNDGRRYNSTEDKNGNLQKPESHTSNDQVTGLTSDPTRGVTKKQDENHGHESHVSKEAVRHRPESELSQKSKGVVIFGPRSEEKLYPENASTKPSHVINITAERSTRTRDSHRLSSQLKVSSARSAKKPGLASKNDGGRYNSTEDKNERVTKSKKQLRSKSVVQDLRKIEKEERPQNPKTLKHHISRQDITRNDDDNERIENESNSSRLDATPQNAKNGGKTPSQSQQVEVLTSRTPPTSLLTTSNDDNAYSIKEIVQGPQGSSLIDVHSDDRKIHSLETKVSKLENEVTVLETAMAGLVNRLLVIEHKSEHPKPTMPAFLPPPKEGTPRHEHPVHSQQQTTVYIGKDVAAAPQISTSQNGAEKIVIPISSMYPGGERHLSTPSVSMHEVDDDLESKGEDVTASPQIPTPQNGPEKIVIPISSLYPGGERHLSTHSATIHEVADDLDSKDDSRSEGKLEDSTHEAIPLGARYVPTSEAHAVVRPIVNIIVPSNQADVLSARATCLPRCQNGGRCLDGNTCRCPTFFLGDHCERFSLGDLLESRKLRSRPYRKVQRVVVSESPDQQDLDGTFRLDSRAPSLDFKDLNLDQNIEPEKAYVAKQQPVEISSPSNSANAQGVTRRRQLILEI